MYIVKYKKISSVVLFVADAAGHVHLHQHTGRVCVAARGPYRGETVKGNVLVALDWGCSLMDWISLIARCLTNWKESLVHTVCTLQSSLGILHTR